LELVECAELIGRGSDPGRGSELMEGPHAQRARAFADRVV